MGFYTRSKSQIIAAIKRVRLAAASAKCRSRHQNTSLSERLAYRDEQRSREAYVVALRAELNDSPGAGREKGRPV